MTAHSQGGCHFLRESSCSGRYMSGTKEKAFKLGGVATFSRSKGKYAVRGSDVLGAIE